MLNYVEIKDTVYRKIDGVELKLDLFVPREKNEEKIPCCVFFHGGGWIEGGKKDVEGFPLITDKIVGSGAAVASVEYRLVGKNGGGFPQSVEDCLYALKFLDEQSICPINRFRKGLFGISAGGYMALMAALAQNEFGVFSPVAAVADMCGIVWFGGKDGVFDKIKTPETTLGFIRDFLGGRSPEMTAPVEFLTSSPQRPKLLIVHGDNDECVNVLSSREFYARAKKAGYDAEYLEVKNSNHTFYPVGGALIPKAQILFDKIGDFLAKSI
ncbi:MAG: alpha/beta hydrolase [Eubacteriales bacterium]|nr:alpha/beta hydrolase [Eubacteriales bacterium]